MAYRKVQEEKDSLKRAPLSIAVPLDPVIHSFSYVFFKRILDIVIAFVALIFLSPLLILIVLVLKIGLKGPVFYVWSVIGQGGQPFVSYKFCTMCVNADESKKGLLQYNEMVGPVFKMRNDPRITPIGWILRKFSLNEMPQLWSVLKGDMSLVGPRPPFPYEWKQFNDWQRRKLSIKPGMISLWHVSGKPNDFNQWARLDLEYIDNWSLWLDLKILLLGIPYLLLGKGESTTQVNPPDSKTSQRSS